MSTLEDSALESVVEQWLFAVLGVFTTCCYRQDFAALDLLRYPQSFSGVTSASLVTFDLPDWFPLEQGILKADDGSLFSRLKDLPLERYVNRNKGKGKVLNIKLPKAPPVAAEFTLTYTPWFRFAHTGKLFSLSESVSGLACRVVEYAARRSGMRCEFFSRNDDTLGIFAENHFESFSFLATGSKNLRKITFESKNSQAVLDLERREVKISSHLTPKLFAAAQAMHSIDDVLMHCVIVLESAGEITLKYNGVRNV